MTGSILSVIKNDRLVNLGKKAARAILKDAKHFDTDGKIIKLANWLHNAGFSKVKIDHFEDKPLHVDLRIDTDQENISFVHGFFDEVSDHLSSPLNKAQYMEGEDGCYLFRFGQLKENDM